MSATIEMMVPPGAALGEGPVWDDEAHALWWLDILGHTVHRYDVASGHDDTFVVDGEVGMLALAADGGLILGIEHRLVHRSLDGALRVVACAPRGDRFNDGKCDATGLLVTGTMSRALTPGASALYCLAPTGLQELLPDVTLSNGLEWSEDGRTFWWTDTVTQRVEAFDVDPSSGALSGRRTVIDCHELAGRPDGFTVDQAGGFWVAMARGAAIRNFAPDGTPGIVCELPVTAVTSCTIGGPLLDELWVTTAGMAPGRAPTAGDASGALFRIRGLGIQGRPARRWQPIHSGPWS